MTRQSDNHVSPEVAAAEPAAQPAPNLRRLLTAAFLEGASVQRSGIGPIEIAADLYTQEPLSEELRAALRVDPKAETPEESRLTRLREKVEAFTGLLLSHHRQEVLDALAAFEADITKPAAERQGVAPPPDLEEAVIEHCEAHWFTQGGQAQFGSLDLPSKNPDGLISAILTTVRATRQEIPIDQTFTHLPTDVDTLRRLRERVDAALDEKYTHKVVAQPPDPSRIESYHVEPDPTGGAWHVLQQHDGVKIQIFSDKPRVIVQPERH